eukprot:scaffold3285_cov140-Amphora_coffeaeformis.AAC.4
MHRLPTFSFATRKKECQLSRWSALIRPFQTRSSHRILRHVGSLVISDPSSLPLKARATRWIVENRGSSYAELRRSSACCSNRWYVQVSLWKDRFLSQRDDVNATST